MNFEEKLRERSEDARATVYRFLPAAEGQQRLLLEAMNYSVRAGGKRLRPILMRLSYELFEGKTPRAQLLDPFMAAIEMIHTHSLIHDDLPAMDNDTLRRGQKTCHVVYGEAMAILAGDALLNLAYETAMQAFFAAGPSINEEEIPGDSLTMGACRGWASRGLRILSEKTGSRGMMGGQSVDVLMDGKPLSGEQIGFIYDLKTGALIEAALMIGAALAGAGQADIDKMSRIGHNVGLAFQIRDDILDVIGDQARLGKDIGSDEKNGKTTYVTINGLEKAQAQAQALSEEAVALLEQIPGEKAFLRELLLRLTGRTY